MTSNVRSRDGCWTCRKRKKKCDGERPRCHNCERLTVPCEGYSPKILWEDDIPRSGMRRRGPGKAKVLANQPSPGLTPQIFKIPSTLAEERMTCEDEVVFLECANNVTFDKDEVYADDEPDSIYPVEASKDYLRPPLLVRVDDLVPSSPFRFLSPHPLNLTPLQSLFFDHYLNNFSLKYPTFLDPSNPFLSTLVPLALRNKTVLNAVLSIGGIQTGLETLPDVRAEILALKGRTLRGCRKLLQSVDNTAWTKHAKSEKFISKTFPTNLLGDSLCGRQVDDTEKVEIGDEEKDLMLYASVMLLMVHDKLSGESCSHLRPHLKFAHHFERRTQAHRNAEAKRVGTIQPLSIHYKFLRNVFLYNDLLASMASGSPTLRDYGQETGSSAFHNPDSYLDEDGPSLLELASNRYYLPILLSRIANGSSEVTLADIERWDGIMTWLPSFSSTGITSTVASHQELPSSAPIADEFENKLISEIYRNATRIFYLQRLRNDSNRLLYSSGLSARSPGSDSNSQIRHFKSILLANLRLLPLGSAYESSLLFPIGIAAMEIHDTVDKTYVLSRVQQLEERFQLNHFRKFREKLSAFWEGYKRRQDDGINVSSRERFVQEQFGCDAILLG